MTSVLTILRILSDLVISFPQRIMSDKKKKITLDHFSRPCNGGSGALPSCESITSKSAKTKY